MAAISKPVSSGYHKLQAFLTDKTDTHDFGTNHMTDVFPYCFEKLHLLWLHLQMDELEINHISKLH